MKYNLPFYETAKSEYLSDTETVRKTFRLAILAEQVIKFHTAVIVQNFLQSKDVRAEGKAYLGRGLSRPSLGLWAFFTEMIFPMIESEDLFWRDFPEYFQTTLKPITGELIPFRNTLHHGPTPSTQTCSTYQENIFPLIEKLETSGILGRERLVIGELISGSTTRNIDLISDDGRVLNLTPLLYYKEIIEEEVGESSKYFFYNDMRKSKEKAVGLLNYEIGLRETSDIYEEFRKTYPLEDWNTLQFARFQTRIDELTENFQGRTKELGDIQNFLKKGVGSFFVFGGPGMGKSSLLARAITLTLSSMEEKTDYSEEKYEIGENMGVCDYFIRRNTNTSYATTFFQMVGDDLEGIFQTGIQIGNNLDEMKQKWGERLLKIESKLKENKKENEKILKNKKEEKLKPTLLVIFIDGLDEGEDEIIKSIPAKAYEKILFLCSARDHVRQNLSHIESRMEISLAGLHPQEIAGLLRTLTLATKLDELYLKAVVEKSGGSPLYLKMLSDAILRGEIKPGELSNLPKEANEFYEEILGRMKAHPLGDEILKTLFLLTISKDFITGDTIAYFLGTDRHTVEDYLATAKEVLWENPQTEDRLDYQLFHESLRDYIRRIYPAELQYVRQTFLLQGIRNWEEIHLLGLDPYTDEYLLKYSITHLLEDKATQKEAEDLVLNPDFLEAQLTTLNFYTVPMNDSKSVLQAIILELGGKVGESKPIHEIFLPKTNPEELFRTTRLVQLVNHTGEVGYRAGSDIGIAWKWVEEGKVAEALERLRPIQDKQRLFDCYILVLWLLTLQEDGENNRINFKLVLAEVEKNIPDGIDIVIWHKRYTVKFFGEICVLLMGREIDIEELLDRGEDEKKYEVILFWLDFFKSFNSYDSREMEMIKSIEKYKNKIIQISRKIISLRYKCIILSSLGEFIYSQGDIELSKFLFTEVNEVIDNIDNPREKSLVIINLFESISNTGNNDFFINYFPLLVDIARRIIDHENRSQCLMKLGEMTSNKNILNYGNVLHLEAIEGARKIYELYDRYSVLSILATSISKQGDLNIGKGLLLEALDLARQINDNSSRGSALANLGLISFQLEEFELGKILFQEATEIDYKIEDSYFQSIAISKLGALIFQLFDFDKGKELLFDSLELSLKIKDPEFLGSALITLCESISTLRDKDFSNFFIREILINIQEIKEPFYESNTLCKIGNIIFKINEIDWSRELFHESLEKANNIKYFYSKSRSISDLADAYKNLGELDLSKKLFCDSMEITGAIEIPFSLALAISNLGSNVLQMTDLDYAKYQFFLLLERARNIQDRYDRTKILSDFGGYSIKLDEIETGQILYKESLDNVIELDDSIPRSILLVNIAQSLSKAGSNSLGEKFFPRVIEIAREIEEEEIFGNLISKIGEELALLRNYELLKTQFPILLNLAEKIEDSEVKFNTISSFSKSISALGSEIDLLNLLQIINILVLEIKDLYYRSLAFINLGESALLLGFIKEGEAYQSEALELANGVQEPTFRSTILFTLGMSLFRQDKLDLSNELILKSIDIAFEIKLTYARSRTLSILGNLCVEKGDKKLGNKLFNDSIQIIRSIEESYYKGRALSNLAESIAQTKDIEIGDKYFPDILRIAIDIKSSYDQRDAIVKISESVSHLGNLDLAKIYFPLLLNMGLELEDSNDKCDAIQSIAKAIAPFISFSLYNFFENFHESGNTHYEMAKSYLQYFQQIDWNDPKSNEIFSYYLRSFGWIPYEVESAKAGAYDLISTLAKLGKIDEALEAARGIGMIGG